MGVASFSSLFNLRNLTGFFFFFFFCCRFLVQVWAVGLDLVFTNIVTTEFGEARRHKSNALGQTLPTTKKKNATDFQSRKSRSTFTLGSNRPVGIFLQRWIIKPVVFYLVLLVWGVDWSGTEWTEIRSDLAMSRFSEVGSMPPPPPPGGRKLLKFLILFENSSLLFFPGQFLSGRVLVELEDETPVLGESLNSLYRIRNIWFKNHSNHSKLRSLLSEVLWIHYGRGGFMK